MSLAPREHVIRAADGRQLFARDWGPAEGAHAAVLCLPGLTRNSKDFNRLAPRLALDRRVICPDLRGRGRSERDPDWRNYDPRVYLDDLRHILAALGVARFHVVGISMGGLLGMALGVAMPNALVGLVINDVGPEINRSGASRILAYIATDRPQPDWPSAIAHLRTNLRKLSLSSDADWREFAENTYAPGPDGRLHFDWDVNLAKPLLAGAGDSPDLWALWRSVRRLPILVIRGGESDVLSAATLERMRTEKPDLVAVTLPGIGHAPTLDEPPSREAIDAYFREH